MKRKATRKPKPARTKSRTQNRRTSAEATQQDDAINALVTAGAQALGLTLDPAWHAGIEFNLQLILHHAALVEGFPLSNDAEPAPVFHA